jgi:hypothetical protein
MALGKCVHPLHSENYLDNHARGYEWHEPSHD